MNQIKIEFYKEGKRITKKEIELLRLVEQTIIADVESIFLKELHMNGRLFDDRPLIDVGFIKSNDEWIVNLISSYVTYSLKRFVDVSMKGY